MTETPRSSFIPKQTMATVPSRARRRRKYNVFGFIATVLLLGAIFLSVGVFLYRDVMVSQLEGEKEALREQRSLFNEADIANVRDLDAQLAAGMHLLDTHAAFSKVFDTLQLTTKESVQFTGIELERRPSNDVSVVIEGATEEFTAVALQATQFGRDPIMQNTIFTDITTADKSAEDLLAGNSDAAAEEDEPRVTFSVEGNIAGPLLQFEVATVEVYETDQYNEAAFEAADVLELPDEAVAETATPDTVVPSAASSTTDTVIDEELE